MSNARLCLSAVLASALTLAGCSAEISPSSTGTTANGPADFASLRDFTKIDVTGPDDVVVTVGPAFSVAAEGDAKTIERLEMSVENGTLRIGRKKGMGNFWGNNGKGVTIRVSMPAIASAALTGSGNMTLDNVRGKALDLALTGSGEMALASAQIAALKAEITGSGGIKLSGTADNASFSATGSGNIDAAGLKAAKADISLLGSGDVSLASDGNVVVHIMGSGDVDVRGKAKCQIAAMGSGTARCSA